MLHHLKTPDHDDVIKWKHFPRYWPFVRGIHRSPVNSPHKGQWRGALVFSMICARINGWVNTGEAGDLRRYPAHYDVIVMVMNNQNTLVFSHPRHFGKQKTTTNVCLIANANYARDPNSDNEWNATICFQSECTVAIYNIVFTHSTWQIQSHN